MQILKLSRCADFHFIEPCARQFRLLNFSRHLFSHNKSSCTSQKFVPNPSIKFVMKFMNECSFSRYAVKDGIFAHTTRDFWFYSVKFHCVIPIGGAKREPYFMSISVAFCSNCALVGAVPLALNGS